MQLLSEEYDQIDPRFSFVPIVITKPGPLEDDGVQPGMSEWWFDHEAGPLFDELSCVLVEYFEIVGRRTLQ